ncbi:MAG: serine/threonine protein kinase, partial [Gammaproteobacteria bacterium]|nr:serine/threonine protein kinase [Gammaproteobacteria bacterium]
MLQTGTNLGHYQILRSLGAGGMADVYEAQDTRLGRRVALKILPPELGRNPQLVARFEKEVRAAALLNHRNIVTVFEVGEQDGNHYYAMRLLTGGDLRARINRGIKPLEALAILRELSDAFAHAHARGFVHRDVKPENIVFDEQGFPVLTDFGIAKALDADTKMTGTGVAIGTPRYISPEQARGRPVDARADLYSLGAVLYEMLTGSPPYDADEPMAVILKHVSEPVPKLPAPLAYLQSLIDKTMAKEPDQRVASAAELVAMIDALQPRVRTAETASSAATMQNPLVANFLTPSPLHPTPAPAGPRLGPARRKQVATYAAAGVAAVIGVALIAIPALHREETAPPAAAAVPADAPAP